MRFFKLFRKRKTLAGELFFSNEFLITGASHFCTKNVKKKRRNVIKHKKPGALVYLEKYMHEDSVGYMVIDPKTGLDLGVLTPNAASWIYEKCNNTCVRCHLTKRDGDSFRILVNAYH